MDLLFESFDPQDLSFHKKKKEVAGAVNCISLLKIEKWLWLCNTLINEHIPQMKQVCQ